MADNNSVIDLIDRFSVFVENGIKYTEFFVPIGRVCLFKPDFCIVSN